MSDAHVSWPSVCRFHLAVKVKHRLIIWFPICPICSVPFWRNSAGRHSGCLILQSVKQLLNLISQASASQTNSRCDFLINFNQSMNKRKKRR